MRRETDTQAQEYKKNEDELDEAGFLSGVRKRESRVMIMDSVKIGEVYEDVIWLVQDWDTGEPARDRQNTIHQLNSIDVYKRQWLDCRKRSSIPKTTQWFV